MIKLTSSVAVLFVSLVLTPVLALANAPLKIIGKIGTAAIHQLPEEGEKNCIDPWNR